MSKTPARKSSLRATLATTFQDFFSSSSSGGIVILLSTAIAMLWTNLIGAESYHHLLTTVIDLVIGSTTLHFTVETFVNDGLMVIFFLAVGLEIKREVLIGELSSRRKAMLPMIAAVAGMVGPALIYVAFNAGTPAIRGWGVPVATDIAFALGILALLGNRVPLGLKVFLAALAIVDDLLSVLVIALFYSGSLDMTMLAGAAAVMAVLIIGNRAGVVSIRFYAVLGVVLWLFVLHSGVHATIAGVLLAMTVPAQRRLDGPSFFEQARDLVNDVLRRPAIDDDDVTQMDAIRALEDLSEEVQSPLSRIEHGLQPYVSFVIMPIFALVNAGVHIVPSMLSTIFAPISLGIMLGLVAGKQIGITAAAWLSLRLGWAELPEHTSLKHLYGVSVLCGIGFTMALFVGHLAFETPEHLEVAKLAIIIGSTISALLGSFLLRRWLPVPQRRKA